MISQFSGYYLEYIANNLGCNLVLSRKHSRWQPSLQPKVASYLAHKHSYQAICGISKG